MTRPLPLGASHVAPLVQTFSSGLFLLRDHISDVVPPTKEDGFGI